MLPVSVIPSDMTRGVSEQLNSWAQGIEHEIEFWDDWLKTRGGAWPEDYEKRLKADDPWGTDRQPVPSPHWTILDVGAGPATRLPKAVMNQKLAITAVDPLAPLYAQITDAAAYAPPIKTTQGFAEDLTALFGANTFDLTNCQNALDHSFEPLRAIEEMLIVTKVGGAVSLIHAVDEAETEKYSGFHQWNFNIRRNEFVIWNRHGDTIVDQIFNRFARFEHSIDGNAIKTIIWKNEDLPIDLDRRRQERLQAVLSGAFLTIQSLAARRTEPAAVLDVPSAPKSFVARLRDRLSV